MHNGTLLAAVDLGSNSFRLEIGRYEHGHIQRVEYLKETVRQGNGLDEDRNLTPDAMQRGWDCLARFGERLAGFSRTQVRAVATQTLREARNREEFIARGSQVLGYPIDVVSGPEEARLIYQGVARLLPQSDERRLVVDIGGRSTELILGQQFTPHAVASFRVGSVAWSSRYFANGAFTPQAFMAAEIAAKAVLDEALATFRPDGWDVAYGSSGTAGAVGDILAAAGGPEDLITREGLDWLQERLLRAQSADRIRLDGLKDERRAVIGGGISVLRAVFDLLAIEQMQVAQGALRQGALYDLLDREQPGTDLRSTTVHGLMQRFGVDVEHAERVARIACQLFDQAAPAGSERASRKL
ncbi:exopolyphosphatase, partial [Acidovorax sp.]|uniref:Ppx/GppA phosphatase family protein n=1 Tax=Acidovorax sp. TaxID=1872122 RepID=UPI00391F2AA2